MILIGFPGGSDGKESACDAGDPASMPGPGRSSGEGNGYPLQCSCLENSMDRGAWRATVQSDMTEATLLAGIHVRIRAEMQFMPPHVHRPSFISLKKLKD